MTNAFGIALLAVAGISFLVSVGAFYEYSEIKQQHDEMCGGFMEGFARLFGNRSCEEAREYMNMMFGLACVCCISGVGMSIFGLVLIFKDDSSKPQIIYVMNPQDANNPDQASYISPSNIRMVEVNPPDENWR